MRLKNKLCYHVIRGPYQSLPLNSLLSVFDIVPLQPLNMVVVVAHKYFI